MKTETEIHNRIDGLWLEARERWAHLDCGDCAPCRRALARIYGELKGLYFALGMAAPDVANDLNALYDFEEELSWSRLGEVVQ